MARSGKKDKKEPAKRSAPKKPRIGKLEEVRKGGARVQVANSGLEVWLYDDANLAALRAVKGADRGAGGMPPGFVAKTKKGLIVGYSLRQDDEIQLAVFVGNPLSDEELGASRWLEPQTAFLRLPSGVLCVESNDASRVGPEYMAEHAPSGARVEVPPGDYRLTLYRVDHEALDREGLKFQGPQEVVVLTPGGKPADAAKDLLPFEPRRDTSWVGQYTIEGRRAQARAWFADYWDTFVLNLDAAALKKMGLKPGSYFRAHVPEASLTLVAVYGPTWEDARRLPPPEGLDLDEYDYAALTRMSDWNGAEALLGRRDAAKTRVEDKHHNVWLEAEVEVLDTRPQRLSTGGKAPTALEQKPYYDPGFLGMILSDLLPEVADLDELPLPAALKHLDAKLVKLGLDAKGDRSWEERRGPLTTEMCVRFYAGLKDLFVVIWATEGSFQLTWLSELADGSWILTGLADDMERRIKRKGPDGRFLPNPRVRFESLDEPLPTLFAAHKKALGAAAVKRADAPRELQECVSALERFKKAAFE